MIQPGNTLDDCKRYEQLTGILFGNTNIKAIIKEKFKMGWKRYSVDIFTAVDEFVKRHQIFRLFLALVRWASAWKSFYMNIFDYYYIFVFLFKKLLFLMEKSIICLEKA